MMFRFDQLRAAQAAGFLLKLTGNVANYTWLIKVLYLADRESLRLVGSPIAGSSFCNMKNGPLASDIYDCIKGKVGASEEWGRYIVKDGTYDVCLVADPGDGELSEFDESVLKSLYERHKTHDFKRMIKIVHELDEWKNKQPEENSSVSLSHEEILKGAGVEQGRVAEFEELNRHVAYARRAVG